MKPIIGVVARPLRDTAKRLNSQVLDVTRRKILKNGGIPMGILPTQDIDFYHALVDDGAYPLNEEEKESLVSQINACDGIFMQGGQKWFGYDEFIINYAREHNIPCLAVCMSMQLMGTMDLRNHGDDTGLITVENHKSESKYVHNVIIDNSSLLYDIVGKTKIQVNSRHSYALPHTKSLKISGVCEDGVIEAIEDAGKSFYLGLQWHPEMMENKTQGKILKYFIDRANSNK